MGPHARWVVDNNARSCTIDHMGQYDKVKWRGATISRRQRQAFIATEKAIRKETKYKNFEFIVLQGSWRPRTAYSGTSHTGAGVADLSYAGMSYNTRAEKEKYRTVLRFLRKVGRQGAFGRGYWDKQIDGTGVMPYHYHVCDLDTTGSMAAWQVSQYRLGFNGLYSGVKDKFSYRPDVIRKWAFREGK
jgi:hypothetical protein